MIDIKNNFGTVLKIILYSAFFYTSLFAKEKKDSLNTDSVEIKKEIILFTPHKYHGLISNDSTLFSFSKRDIQYDNYFTINDIFYSKLPVYPLTSGRISSSNNWQAYGSRQNAFKFNNRDLFSSYRSYNPLIITPESFENVEVFSGSEAVIYGSNSTGLLINFQERNYNTGVPYVRFWIGEGHDDYVGSEIVWAQNIMPNLNMNINFSGARDNEFYQNTNFDYWNLSSVFKYNLSDTESVSFKYHWFKLENELFGGIDADRSVDNDGNFSADPLNAISLYNDSRKIENRNDITLTYSNPNLNANLYLTSINNLLDRDSLNVNDSIENDSFVFLQNQIGSNIVYTIPIIENYSIKTGAFANYNFIEENYYRSEESNFNLGAFSLLEINLFKRLKQIIGTRISYINSNMLINLGTKLNLYLDEKHNHTLTLDLSRSQININNFFIKNNVENHSLAIFKYNYNGLVNDFGIEFFARNIENNISFNSINRFGSILYFNKVFKTDLFITNDRFELNFKLNIDVAENDGLNYKELPLYYGSVDLAYFFRFGRSNLRTGFFYKFAGDRNSLNYNEIYDYYSINYSNQNPILDLFNIYAKFQLGRAFLKVSYINALSSQSNYIHWYPNTQANLRITAAWTILD